MMISYRTRQIYRRLWRVIWILALVTALVIACWVLWLRRFVVYTNQGVRFDFDLPQEFPQGQVSQQTPNTSVPDIYFTDPPPTKPPVVEENENYAGYYVTVDDLLANKDKLDVLLAQIQALPEGTPLMVDVKGYWGYFYYDSELGTGSSSLDIAAMQAFFEAVNASGVHAIAKLPAFRDYDFADQNNACGLKIDKGYLWVDSGRCYWLDPGSEKVQAYLVQIARELRDLGFDEVAFTNFTIPEDEAIVYPGDRQAALDQAAQTLLDACVKEDFVLSFITEDPGFALPEGNCRLYLENVAAADVQTVISAMDPSIVERTVFFAHSNDTRYDICGVIRPLNMAQTG